MNSLIEKLKYYSRTYLGLCKNDGCLNYRRYCSAYCEECSIKYNKGRKKKG